MYCDSSTFSNCLSTPIGPTFHMFSWNKGYSNAIPEPIKADEKPSRTCPFLKMELLISSLTLRRARPYRYLGFSLPGASVRPSNQSRKRR